MKKALAMDFSPESQTPTDIINLLQNKNVPAKIRTRIIENEKKYEMKYEWQCLNYLSMYQNPMERDAVDDPDLEDHYLATLVDDIKRMWGTEMNLYNHNCQHFCKFVKEYTENYEWCLI